MEFIKEVNEANDKVAKI